jgi:hypothetical protein
MPPALEHMDVTVRRSGVSIAPGAQIGLRRRNVSFAEAIRKPRFHEAFFMGCQLSRYTLSFPTACGPFSGAFRRIGRFDASVLQWCRVVCDVSILCKRVCVPSDLPSDLDMS